jgi:hypothetical protein
MYKARDSEREEDTERGKEKKRRRERKREEERDSACARARQPCRNENTDVIVFILVIKFLNQKTLALNPHTL